VTGFRQAERDTHSPYKDLSNEDPEAKIKELKEKLGWPAELRILPPADDDGSKPN
jgi:hypothetical protein